MELRQSLVCRCSFVAGLVLLIALNHVEAGGGTCERFKRHRVLLLYGK